MNLLLNHYKLEQGKLLLIQPSSRIAAGDSTREAVCSNLRRMVGQLIEIETRAIPLDRRLADDSGRRNENRERLQRKMHKSVQSESGSVRTERNTKRWTGRLNGGPIGKTTTHSLRLFELIGVSESKAKRNGRMAIRRMTC